MCFPFFTPYRRLLSICPSRSYSLLFETVSANPLSLGFLILKKLQMTKVNSRFYLKERNSISVWSKTRLNLMDPIPLIIPYRSAMGSYYLYAFKSLHYKPLNFKGHIHFYIWGQWKIWSLMHLLPPNWPGTVMGMTHGAAAHEVHQSLTEVLQQI